MTKVLEWLLGLDRIRLDRDAPLELRFNTQLEPWVLFAIALTGIACIALVYRAERASVGRRVTLGVIRCALAALVVAVLCGPSLVLQRNRVEASHVAFLLDKSFSMATADRYSDATIAARVARGAGLAGVDEIAQYGRMELVRRALARDDAAPLVALLERNGVQILDFAVDVDALAFAANASALPLLADAIQSVKPDATGTDIPAALTHTIERSQGRRLAAIVLASDGRSTQPTPLKDALDLASDRQIPIYPVRIGSADRVVDLEIEAVSSQQNVFVNDVVAVEAFIYARGLLEPITAVVRLVDERNQETVATESVTIDPTSERTRVELRAKPSRPGSARYRIEVEKIAGETVFENNAESVQLVVAADRIRVLYVEGYPRFEYRYLKNALVRESTVELSVLLLEADEQFVQEGTDPIRRFPETAQELLRYNVVLFGDVDPKGGWLTGAQAELLVDFVGKNGGGFGLIAGERAAPQRFRDTPLERLIPVRIDPTFAGRFEEPLLTGFRPQLTPEGRRSRLFRFAADRKDAEGMFQSLPELYWYCRSLGPKPGASVLVQMPSSLGSTSMNPLIVTGRYGAGKLFFQGTDDTWRWRRHTGELLHDSYWVQVVRDLASAAPLGQDRRYAIRTDRRVYAFGAPVTAQVEIFDVELLAGLRDEIEVSVFERGPGAADDPLSPRGVLVERFPVRRLSAASALFDGAFVPSAPGSYTLETADIPAGPGEPRATVAIRVERVELEQRRVEADYEALERIANASGGRVLELDELVTGFSQIRDRSVQIPDDVSEPLWDSKLVLVLFVLMIAMEWIARKAYGLV